MCTYHNESANGKTHIIKILFKFYNMWNQQILIIAREACWKNIMGPTTNNITWIFICLTKESFNTRRDLKVFKWV